MIKDRAILFGWIAGLLIITAVIWVIVKPLHARYLMTAVNRVFINTGYSHRLSSYMDAPSGKAGLLGYWYKMNNTNDLLFVFAVFQNGIFVPCGAIVSYDGKVNEIIPLSAHARQVFNNVPQSLMRIYIQRIETIPRPAAAGAVLSAREGNRR